MNSQRLALLQSRIVDVPDFPKPGILFKDLSPLMADAEAFATCLDLWQEWLAGRRVDVVVGIESRGFIFGAALATRLGKGFVSVRKPGKLPRQTHRQEYALEYGTDALEIHRDAIEPQQRVLLVDDVLATGGTAAATVQLLRLQGADLVGAAFVLELCTLRGGARLDDLPYRALLQIGKP